MCFAPEVLERLLSRNKDIIGANYYKRNPNKETIIKFIEDGKLVGKPIPEDLFECGTIGTGCMLVKTEVFKKIGFPYFAFKDDIIKEEVGEDVFFCLKAIRNDYKVYCDPTMDIGHIGEAVY
jgi:GT2 family glycosyltransferase